MARTTIPAELVAVNAIQGTLIADNSVTAVHIATNAISGTLVADNAVTSTHIAQNQVTATQIAQNTITVTQMADDAIETAKINASAVTTAKINNGAVTDDKLAANSVTSAKIVNGTIVAADLADNAVTIAKMASLARGKIIYGDSAGDPAALTLGSTGTFLISDGTDISWGNSCAGLQTTQTTALALDLNGTHSGGNYIAWKKGGAAEFYIGSSNTVGSGTGYYDLYAISGYGQRFFTGASERMRITSAGKVGIATTTNHAGSALGYMLTIDSAGASGSILEAHRTGNSRLEIYQNATGGNYIDSLGTTAFTAFATGGTERMRIDSSGTVGIGTTPKGTNTFHADMFVGPSLYIANYSSGSNQQSVFGSNTYYAGGYKAVTGDTSASMVNFSQGKVQFDTAGTVSTDAAQTFTTKLSIANDGDIGMGTTTPQARLHIEGSSGTTHPHILITGNSDTVGQQATMLLRAEGGESDSALRAKGAIILARSGDYGVGKLHIANRGEGDNTSAAVSDANITIDENNNVGINLTTPKAGFHNTRGTLQVLGPIGSGQSAGTYAPADPRIFRDWFVYAGAVNSINRYVHMKTNLWAGGSPAGNTEYTMSCFRYHSAYAYGSAKVSEGMIGWHNWSGAYHQQNIYNPNSNWEIVKASYTSSDGYVVLVADILAAGTYASFSIDWHQWGGYTLRQRKVTAVSMNASATGAY